MSGAATEMPAVHSAVPIPDLTPLEVALRRGDPKNLAEVLRGFRPADVGRELARLRPKDARRILEASDDRHGAAILRSTHPAVAAHAVARCSPEQSKRLLAFLPIDVQVAGTLKGLGYSVSLLRLVLFALPMTTLSVVLAAVQFRLLDRWINRHTRRDGGEPR